MTTIKLDFSNVPSDVALFLTEQEHTQELTDALARIMRLAPDDRELMHQEIFGSVAKVVDSYLDRATRPPGA